MNASMIFPQHNAGGKRRLAEHESRSVLQIPLSKSSKAGHGVRGPFLTVKSPLTKPSSLPKSHSASSDSKLYIVYFGMLSLR